MRHLDSTKLVFKKGGSINIQKPPISASKALSIINLSTSPETNWINPSNIPYTTYQDLTDEQKQEILNWRHTVENPNNKGYNSGKYVPYNASGESFKTVGDGFKVGSNPYVDNILATQGYLTEDQHNEAKKRRLEKDINAAKKYYKADWYNLPYSTKFVNLDVQFNPGLSKFKKLKTASVRNDKQNIGIQHHRTQNGKPLGRNSLLDDYYNKLLQLELVNP